MVITTKDDYKCDIKNEFSCMGFPNRNENAVRKMKPGDKIIVYVIKKSVFMAALEVTGEYYYSEKTIWDDPYFFDLWAHRVPTKPLCFIDDVKKGVYIKDIWDNLNFITNKNKWGSQVMGSFRKLTENDYNVIYNSIMERINGNK